MKIHHIGYLVKSIDRSVNELKKLGYTESSKKIKDKKRKVEIQFMSNNKYNIELISPLNENAQINNLLKKQGPSPYHICYEVKNIETKVEELINKGYIVIEKPESAIAIDNKEVAFLYSKNIGLIEIVEES